MLKYPARTSLSFEIAALGIPAVCLYAFTLQFLRLDWRLQTTAEDISAVFLQHYASYKNGALNVNELARVRTSAGLPRINTSAF